MTADPASPDTPTDPRQAANQTAIDAARAYAKSIERDLWAPRLFAIAVAEQVVDALAAAGLLSLSGDSTQTTDGTAHEVYVRMRHADVDRTECINAVANIDRDANGGLIGFEILGAIDVDVDGQSVLGSLRSRASGTPSETIAEALRGYRLNLGPNTVDSIKQGMTRLDLTGSERRDIGLIAAKALGLEEL